MGNIVKIKYTSIYQTVEELRTFLANDLLISSQKSYDQLLDLLGEMDGKTQRELLELLVIQKEKTELLEYYFQRILDFIVFATYDMEITEKEIADQLTLSEEA